MRTRRPGGVLLVALLVGACGADVHDEAQQGVASQTVGLLESSAKVPRSNPLSSRLGAVAGSRTASAQHAPQTFGRPFKTGPRQLKQRITVNPRPDAGLVLPHWTGSFQSQGTTFPYAVVGTDPVLGQTTTIATYVIPYRFVFPNGTVLDASSDVIDGLTPLQGVMSSPIFQPAPFNAGPTSLGVTQWSDAVMRAEFWDRLPKNDGYHVLLAPTVLPTVTVNVPAGIGYSVLDSGSDRPYGVLDAQWTEDLLAAEMVSLGTTPNALPIHLFSEILLHELGDGGTIGYHYYADLSRQTGIAGYQTYIQTGYFGADVQWLADQPESAGTGVLAHEVAEWLMDPAVFNMVPPWQMPGFDHVCFDPLLEVGDPIEDLPVHFQVPANRKLYNFPDIALLPYFSHKAAPGSLNGGWETLLNTFSAPSTTCSYTLFARQGFSFGPQSTAGLTGLNNTKSAVGYAAIAGGLYALQFTGFDPTTGSVGTVTVVNPPVPDQPGYLYPAFPGGISDGGTIIGTFFDASGFPHGFIDQAGQYTTIDVPGAIATTLLGLDNRARMDIVGQYADARGAAHGFVLHNGKFVTIDVPFGINTSVNGINDHRQIVGTYESNGVQIGFQAALPETESSDNASAFVSVSSPQSFNEYRLLSTQLLGIGNHGEVIGSQTLEYDATGYVWKKAFQIVNGSFQFLPGGFDNDGAFDSTANAINDSGIVVGQTTITTGTWATDWTPFNLFNFDFGAASNVSTFALPVNRATVLPMN